MRAGMRAQSSQDVIVPNPTPRRTVNAARREPARRHVTSANKKGWGRRRRRRPQRGLVAGVDVVSIDYAGDFERGFDIRLFVA